jgi:recombination protein RecA
MAVPLFARMQQDFTKKFGAKSMLAADDLTARGYITYGISSQCLCLDLAMGRPGFPAGHLSEIFGQTNQGKSLLAYHILAECQRRGGVSILIDTEYAYEMPRLQALGVNPGDLWVWQPTTLEEMFEKIDYGIHRLRDTYKFTGPVVVVVDTIAGMPAAVEVAGGYDHQTMGVSARVIGLGLRKIMPLIAEHKVVLIFCNQLRQTLEQYGEKFVTYGGMKIPQWSVYRVRISSRQTDLIKKGQGIVGSRPLAWMVKNKLAMPFGSTRYTLNFASGIDQMGDLWDAAERLKVLHVRNKQLHFTLGEKSIPLEREQFDAFVLDKFASPAKLRERLTAEAIARNVLLPYGDVS